MILEGIVTTMDAEGRVNIAPMGPHVEPDWSALVLRPFPSSTTCANLIRHGHGVFHVTDDVELLARAAIGRLVTQPPLEPLPDGTGFYLADACRWYAFEVRSMDRSEPRFRLECRVTARGWIRDFLGFQRAKHAVVEAAILATRVGILPWSEIREQWERLRIIVDKTAGPAERRAFDFLDGYLSEGRE